MPTDTTQHHVLLAYHPYLVIKIPINAQHKISIGNYQVIIAKKKMLLISKLFSQNRNRKHWFKNSKNNPSSRNWLSHELEIY